MAMKKICAGIAVAMLISSAAMAADEIPSELNADSVEYDAVTKKAKATGTVHVKHGQENNTNALSELNADAVEYDMNTGIVAAAGNILLKQGATKATGLHAMFNVNTKEAHLIGNVIVVRDDMRITCNALASNGQGYMVADGNVIATQTVAPDAKYPNGDTRTFTSEHIDYFPDDKKHFIIPKGGLAKSEVDGTFTADQMEGWIDDEHYVGRGNAHLISPARNMEAGGDMVDYSGKDAGKAVLSGNAWAYQDNNTIRGNRLTVYLADDGTLKADNNTTPKLELPKFDIPQMQTVDKAFDKKEPAQVETVAEDKVSEDKASENKVIEDKAVDEEILIEPVEEKSADEKTLVEPEKKSDEATSNEP